MAKRLDKLLIVDLEATCWEDGNHNRSDGQISEIIEVGVATVDLARNQIETAQSIIVRPEKSKVSPFCTQLTTLTQADVDKGITFAQACHRIRNEFDPFPRTWASWGDYDRVQFEREARAKGLRSPFGRTHINLKNLFAIMKGHSRELSVHEALDACGMKFEGTPHRGIDDARNIARLFTYMFQ